jgi:hypothetical protein
VDTSFPPERSRQQLVPSISASAGEARSEKIMLKQKAKVKCEINLNSFCFSSVIATPPID